MQRLTSIIEEAIRQHKSKIELFPRITDDDVYYAVRNVMRENPDVFWFSHQWHYSQTDTKVHFHYTIDKERSAKIQTQIDDVIENDFRLGYVKTLPIMEQVMYVYKWIALYCNYDIRSAHNQTIYSVFVLRHSVCTGIAKAAQYFLKMLGIESRLVFGKMNNSEMDSRHCWLIVNIEGNWYHLDPTFAMPETSNLLFESGVKPLEGADFLYYNYFCVDTKTILQSRTVEDEDLLPDCPGNIDYTRYQDINVTVSRNGDMGGLGCLLSNTGTTADIYLAHDKNKYYRLRSVAKVFRNDSTHELLRKELIVMRECAGQHLLRATNADFNKGILYMEQATPLAELLASHYYKLTVKEFCNLLMDIAKAWLELYTHGIIYRDLHLNNIYLSDTQINGRYIYKLGDFGSCTFNSNDGRYDGLTKQGGVGSKWYMAPETWKHGIFDERSAVYGVGMIAYYLLNDLRPPLWKEFKEKSFEMRMSGDVIVLPLPSKLREDKFKQIRIPFIQQVLESNVNERYDTLAALIIDIENFINANHQWAQSIIIEGSQFKQDDKKEIETFCSTCIGNPSIEVSNGEEFSLIDVDNNGSADTLIDIDSYASDNVSLVNEHATTCGGWFEGESKSHVSEHNREDNDLAKKRAELKRSLLESGKITIKKREASDDGTSISIPQGKLAGETSINTNRGIKHSSPDRRPSAECFPRPKPIRINATSCEQHNESYYPLSGYNPQYSSHKPNGKYSTDIFGTIKKLLFGHHDAITEQESVSEQVNSSIFAPSETKRGDYMMVQVFLYKDGEERAVACKATEVDPEARRQNYTPLSVKLKNGDRVKVTLRMSGKDIEVEEPQQEMIWQGHYTDCQFGVLVSDSYKQSTMMGTVILSINGIPCGRMMFKTKIVDRPQKLYAKIESKSFQKIFISYSHLDESKVKYIAEAYRAQGVDYFFDRHYLKAGDVYPVKIMNYINSADLFILCWSKNAEESDYVQLERNQALSLAYPQKDMETATLSIHPISIEPHAAYPKDMAEIYDFEEV